MQTNIWKQQKFLQNFLLLILTTELQGYLLQDFERKFEQLLVDQKLCQLCCGAGLKIVEKGQFFVTLDEKEGPNEIKNLCREYSLPRSEEASRARRWILGNAVMIESLFRDGTCFWVRVVNGILNFATETSETISRENGTELQGNLVAEGKATTKAYCDTVSHFHFSSSKKMDRHQS